MGGMLGMMVSSCWARTTSRLVHAWLKPFDDFYGFAPDMSLISPRQVESICRCMQDRVFLEQLLLALCSTLQIHRLWISN